MEERTKNGAIPQLLQKEIEKNQLTITEMVVVEIKHEM